MADIDVGLRCLQSSSLALLTLSIRFFSSTYTFLGGHPLFNLPLVTKITKLIVEITTK